MRVHVRVHAQHLLALLELEGLPLLRERLAEVDLDPPASASEEGREREGERREREGERKRERKGGREKRKEKRKCVRIDISAVIPPPKANQRLWPCKTNYGCGYAADSLGVRFLGCGSRVKDLRHAVKSFRSKI